VEFPDTKALPQRAMILAAGEGRRLRPLTLECPKCLIEVGGRPLLEHALGRLHQAGVREVVVNVHHLAEQVASYLKKQPFADLRIHLSWETELLDTGGGLYQARRYFKGIDYFYVYNADVYTDMDLTLAARALNDESIIGILLVSKRESTRRLLFDETGELVGWENTTTGERLWARRTTGEVTAWAFNGIQVLRPDIFLYMHELGAKFSLIQAYLKAAAAGAKLKAFRMDDFFWADVGTPVKLAALRKYLEKKQSSIKNQ